MHSGQKKSVYNQVQQAVNIGHNSWNGKYLSPADLGLDPEVYIKSGELISDAVWPVVSNMLTVMSMSKQLPGRII